MKKGISYILLFTAVLVIASCSSSKKDQSYISRVFHNTSAHYNGYYYAKLKLTEAEKQVISVRRENYEKLLPLYLTGNPDDAFSSNDLDSVVKRLTIAVKLHPKSKWADDCYYNIGKAYYYKKDYEGAQAIFQYVSSEFKADAGTSNSSSSKKKKSSSKKKKTADKNVNKYTGTVKDTGKEGETASNSGGAFSMLKHKPIHYTDVLWLIRAQAMTKKFGEAQAIIAYLQEDKKFPAELKADLALTQTFVFIQQQQFKNATGTLLSVIDQTKNKKEATRYTYILAQLYNLSGDYGSSGKYFAQVSDMRPDYEMDFNARINVVKNYIASGSGSPTQVTASLEEMAKNKNFEEFNDQIYYYLGLVHLFQGKNEDAVQNFETSIARSYANNNQKGLSFLKIGEVSMRDEDYLTAAPYYDSAVAFIDSKFDTIERVKDLNATLNEMVKQITIINAQDSLQKLAAMSEKDRNKIVDQMVLKMQRQKEEEANAGQDVTNLFNNQNQDAQPNNQQSGGTWYFYNVALKSAGYTDFVKSWGKRTNADNWRRSNKKSNDASIENADNTDGDESKNGKDSSATSNATGLKASLLDNIPTTPEKLAASNQILFDAYYSLATLYSDNLYHTQKSIATLEKTVNRFGDNKDIVKVYYKLYLLYGKNGSTSLANQTREKILKDYSTSVFASVIQDPDYFKKQYAKENEINTYYASTFDFYQAENFSDVFNRVHAADSLFKPNPIEAKFDLLNALATGKTKDRNAYIAALDTIVKKYPTGEEHDKAVEILTALGAPPKGVVQNLQQQQGKNQDKKPKGPSPYTFKPTNPHYFVVAFNVVDAKTKAIGDSLANYNSKNHSIDNLKVTPQLLDKNSQMIVVKQFKNKDAAMNYYDEVTESETLFEIVESIGYRVFVIDDKNFTLFYNRKNLQEYVDFFEKNYENDDLDDEGE